jgi:p-hydroxybenzoate 3-monooxygenase
MTEAPMRTTVGIVGAGPAGLVVAHILHRENIPFVIMDRLAHAELRGRSKAGLIEYRTVRLLASEGIAGTILHFVTENHRCEFRTPNEGILIDYGALTGGRPQYVYPQHELVGALADALLASGANMRFDATVTGVRASANGVTLMMTDAVGQMSEVHCDVAVGCDGARGAIAAALEDVRVVEQTLSVSWLAVIGEAPPLEAHTIYAAHPRGFAGQMRRGPSLTRYYLEVPATDGVRDWPEHRIRDELSQRLRVAGRLDDVPLAEPPSLVDLRVKVTEPMQRGRIFLAGDAAHLITPAGGKGMNLAIQDAVEVAHGLVDRFGPRQDERRLSRYSETRLPEIWRAQAFSNWMLRLLLAGFGDELSAPVDDVGFGRGLRDGWLRSLQHDPLLARWFAYAYAGVDPD